MNYLFIFIYITHKNIFFVCVTYVIQQDFEGIFYLLFLYYMGDNILTAVPKFILKPFHNYL